MSLLKIWKNRNQILEGIRNKVFKKEHVEEVARERELICLNCDYYNGECLVPGTGPCCGYCGCSLGLKTRSLSSHCDLNKWEAIMTEEEEDMLNEQFE